MERATTIMGLILLVGLAGWLCPFQGGVITAIEASELYSHRVLVDGIQMRPEELSVYQLHWSIIPKGTIIRNSYFILQKPRTDVFPEGMTGVRFVNCAFLNVEIPEGNILETYDEN